MLQRRGWWGVGLCSWVLVACADAGEDDTGVDGGTSESTFTWPSGGDDLNFGSGSADASTSGTAPMSSTTGTTGLAGSEGQETSSSETGASLDEDGSSSGGESSGGDGSSSGPVGSSGTGEDGDEIASGSSESTGGDDDADETGTTTGIEDVCAAWSSSLDAPDLESLSDEFDDPAAFCAWRVLHEVEGTPSTIQSLDVTYTEQGYLTLIPETSGWYADYTGPFLFKDIEGNFRADVSVTASSLTEPDSAPTLPFSSAGLLLRDPASVPGAQNWVMWDMGRQMVETGTEAKTTVNSQSQLFLTEDVASGVLRICRFGDMIDLALRDPETGAFAIVRSFRRTDFPAVLQVGLVATAWNGTAADPNTTVEPDLRARWDYFRVSELATQEDCTL